ncbi:uncharacterized protein LOC114125238, partial [Aphis gossypii]|uniref:uncharacterized protein LOC114125238 n=1 Tax=Aphis gossypii TaxID=80765 RepID=UPI0021593FA2
PLMKKKCQGKLLDCFNNRRREYKKAGIIAARRSPSIGHISESISLLSQTETDTAEGEETSSLAAFLVLPFLFFPLTTKRKKGQPACRPSKVEVRDSFITHLRSHSEVKETITRRKEKYARLGITLQPLTVGRHLFRNEKKNYCFNANVCSNKWRGLKFQFNKVHDNSSKKVTGKGCQTWKYYDILNEFLGSTSNVSPPKECLSSTSFGSPVSNTTTCPKRKSPKVSESGRGKQKMLRLMEERATRDEKKITIHENLLIKLTEANEIEKRKVELLEKLLLKNNH